MTEKDPYARPCQPLRGDRVQPLGTPSPVANAADERAANARARAVIELMLPDLPPAPADDQPHTAGRASGRAARARGKVALSAVQVHVLAAFCDGRPRSPAELLADHCQGVESKALARALRRLVASNLIAERKPPQESTGPPEELFRAFSITAVGIAVALLISTDR